MDKRVQNLIKLLRYVILVFFIVDLLFMVIAPAVSLSTNQAFGLVSEYESEMRISPDANVNAEATNTVSIYAMMCGALIAITLWEAYIITTRAQKGNAFCIKNVYALRRSSVYAFALSLVFLAFTIQIPAIFTGFCVGLFIAAGIFELVLAALFELARKMNEENELTI